MTVNEFIEKYKSDNFDSYIKENATIDYWNDLIKTYKIEKLKLVFPESMQISLSAELKEGKNLLGAMFDGFCERQIKILEIENQYKPQQVEAVKPEKRILGFKEFLNRYEKEALQIDLPKEYPLVYEILEKQKIKLSSADFDEVIEEVIEFCKKAIKSTKESLIVSFSNNHYRGKYKNGNPPFLSQMKTYIEYGKLYKEAIRKKESNKLFESEQQKEINQYFQSYKHRYFSNVIDKRNKEDKENILFYGKVTASILQRRNSELLSHEILKGEHDLLSTYNKHLYFLTGHTMQLFKNINNYLNTSDNSCLTSIKTKEDDVFNSLKNIKDFTKTIKHSCINGEIFIASKIKDYCVLMFDDCIDLLNDKFGIDIYKSPLKTDFEEVKLALDNSINLSELKIISELSTLLKKPLDLSDNPPAEKNKPKKLKKVLFQFIHNIENREEFIKELKETFPTEIGKSIKAIIDILTDEKILVYGTKEFKTLYDEIKLSFNRDIGSYNSIQNVKNVDKETTETVYKKLNPLIVKHKTS